MKRQIGFLSLYQTLKCSKDTKNIPRIYQKQDWYPLNEIGVEETLAFYDQILGEGSPYILHKIFQCTPQFLGIQISDTDAPFPIRALAHPELRLYHRCD